MEMKLKGVCIIGWAGPQEFYEKAAGGDPLGFTRHLKIGWARCE